MLDCKTKYYIAIFLLGLLVQIGAEDLLQQELTSESYEAIKRGLHFLSTQQDKEGFWRSDIGYKLNISYKVTNAQKPHVGNSALACMAFLAGGNTPNRGPYGKNVALALRFILDSTQTANGYIARYGTRMYSHAFATLCLAEIYGMAPQQEIRNKLEKAIRLIVDCQNEQGGWRYEPIAMDADMSITVCQVQALRAARNVGIKVPKKYIDRAIEYVLKSANWNGGFKYQLLPRNQSRTSFALTAAGVTALYGAGIYNNNEIKRGLNYLLNPPRNDPHPRSNHYFYYYGHYYAVQAMYMAGEPYWKNWFTSIRDELISIQAPNGSWRDNTGQIFPTAVALIILQIPFRYLPIFQR